MQSPQTHSGGLPAASVTSAAPDAPPPERSPLPQGGDGAVKVHSGWRNWEEGVGRRLRLQLRGGGGGGEGEWRNNSKVG